MEWFNVGASHYPDQNYWLARIERAYRNKKFFVVGIITVALLVLIIATMICVYLLVIRPKQRQSSELLTAFSPSFISSNNITLSGEYNLLSLSNRI